MNVHLGRIWIDSSQILPKWTREYQSMFRKTRWLLFVRLVGKSKGPETEHLAFDKPQLRLRRPVWEEPPSPSHDKGLDQEPILIDQIRSHQRLDQTRTAIDNNIFARLLFQFGDYF